MSHRFVILFSAPYMIPFLDHFRPELESCGLELIVPEVHERLTEEQLFQYAGQFDGTICGDDKYTARALEACSPRLKVISKWGTGIDSIDRGAAARLGIQVRNTPNAFTLPVADTVLGYMLAFVRRQPWMDRAMKAGHWEKIPGRSLSECVLGVVGVGTIGKAVIRRARAFGMTILGNDIIEVDHVFLAENGVEMTGLDDLLSRADFVSLNCDLNPTSHHLMNSRTFAEMKSTTILINTARGSIVEEPALIAALQTGRIAGAALDVYESEPLPANHPLLKMDNVMLSPHNANSSPAAWERVHRNTIKNLLEGLGIGGTPISPLSRSYSGDLYRHTNERKMSNPLSQTNQPHGKPTLGGRPQSPRTVLITGAAGGIGRATVKLFAESGWKVIGVDRADFAGVEWGEPFPANGLFIQSDISVGENLESIFAQAHAFTGSLNALVNNAAVQITKPVLQTSVEEWDAVMASNLRSVFLSVKLAHPLFKNAGSGVIVNVSSVHAVATSINIASYAASKGGLLALTRAMAIEFAPDNIRVNAILPGAVDTPMLRNSMSRGLSGSGIQDRLDNLARKTVNGRIGRPEEIAHAIYFLADETQSSFMTGQALIVDGGATARLSTE